jgi:hypothetical protein
MSITQTWQTLSSASANFSQALSRFLVDALGVARENNWTSETWFSMPVELEKFELVSSFTLAGPLNKGANKSKWGSFGLLTPLHVALSSPATSKLNVDKLAMTKM